MKSWTRLFLAACCAASIAADGPASQPADDTSPTPPASDVTPATKPSPTTVPAATAALLIRLGGDGAWEDRQAAEDELVTLGEDARPALVEAAARADDPEVRDRAAAALARIRMSAVTSATTITFSRTGLIPADALQELATRLKLRLNVATPFGAAEAGPSDAGPMSVLSAAAEIQRATRRSVTITADAVLVGDVGSGRARAGAELGPARITADRATRAAYLAVGNRQGSVTRMIYFSLDVEPRVRLNAGGSVIRFSTLQGSEGEPIDLSDRVVNISRSGTGAMLGVALPPEFKSSSVALLRGEARLSFFTRVDPFVIDDLSKLDGTVHATPFGDITFGPLVAGEAGAYELKVETPYLDASGLSRLGEMQELLRSEDFRISGANDEPWTKSIQMTGLRDRVAMLRVQLQPPAGTDGPPTKISLIVPGGSASGTFPFEFKELPLP